MYQNTQPLSRPIDVNDVAWLNAYENATLAYFSPRFVAYKPRFDAGAELLSRFSAALHNVLTQGRAHFHAVDEAHNEVCVADAVLADPSTAKATLLYEPSLPNTDKTIDFFLKEADGQMTLIDVKTIKPQPRDRWDQYERAIKEHWLPENVQFIVEQQWQGGELWHAAFASRSRFLEYALELETKLASAAFGDTARRRILMLCGEGFHWHQDELEDFVAYYRTGEHQVDDPFALAEEHHVKANNITLQRSISSFGCLDRRQGDVSVRRVNWDVRAPTPPFALSGAV